MFDWIVARLHSTKLARYAVSIVALIVAAVLTALIIHFKLPRPFTGYGFLLVIIGSAWWGGYGPGLLTRLITDPVQQRRSWYVYLLTTPLGEAALAVR